MPSLAKVNKFVELVTENTSLYVQQCCGKKCFELWCVLSAVQCVTFTSTKTSNPTYHIVLITLFKTSPGAVQMSQLYYSFADFCS
jgi:hypothetical protein